MVLDASSRRPGKDYHVKTALWDQIAVSSATSEPVDQAESVDHETEFRNGKIRFFERKHGFTPNLEQPRKFSEKLLLRILSDPDPFYPLYGTKLNAPFFLAGRVPHGLKFVPRLKVKHRVTPDDFSDLPSAFVMKSSFGSGVNEIITDASTVDLHDLCQKMNAKIPQVVNAQGNSDPANCVIFEAYLGDPEGNAPDDFKFHCFHRKDRQAEVIIQVDSNRFGDHRQSMFDEDLNRLDLVFNNKERHETPPVMPENIGQMITIARQLSDGFDYIRVDLYSIGGEIYFGEFTPFHQGGMGPVSSSEWDHRLGNLWQFRLPAYSGTG
ncbi:hypothetical protein LHL23_02430 [Leisingera sp. McT4-56]|nr:hypothetical protein [Leisingera sp. McT4-56]